MFDLIIPDKKLKLMANAIRFLSINAIQKANSGHPGMPLGFADVATILFAEFLKFNPNDPKWPNRDRFILSAGHGSMLLYSILYLLGYKDISIKDIENFRQLGSKTAGHPEYGLLAGIETTTGPLGQGLGNAVGMAISEAKLREKLGNECINHNIFCVVGDGCLMEGISHEALSLAGHLKLSNLVVLFDSNKISIDGPTSLSTSINHKKLFESYGFDVFEVDGHDFTKLRGSIYKAKKSDNPAIVICNTRIGYGSPNTESTEKCHGSPLGEEEINLVKERLMWKEDGFNIPEEAKNEWNKVSTKHIKEYNYWQEQQSLKYLEFNSSNENEVIFDDLVSIFKKSNKDEATRKSSGKILEFIQSSKSNFIGGSADLSGSNNTINLVSKQIKKYDFKGNYIYYGVREHAMGAVMNGISLHGSFIPYGGTFLIFSDYMRPAIRLSALMKRQVIYVMTHDSIGLGEDGPTHQPVEQLATLRAIPNLTVIRPCDKWECLEAYKIALSNKDGPTLISLSRQNLKTIRDHNSNNLSEKGAYFIKDVENPQITIFASGSELEIACEVEKYLKEKSITACIISIPCVEIFKNQNKKYKQMILNRTKKKVIIEAGIKQSYDFMLNDEDMFFGVEEFGESGKGDDLYKHFGLFAKNITDEILKNL